MSPTVDPNQVAAHFRDAVREEIKALGRPLTLAGFLATDNQDSETYAEYTRSGCEDVGIRFDLSKLDRLDLEAAIFAANENRDIHGIIVYYPVFSPERDGYIRALVKPEKDVEGLHPYWLHKLYANIRFLNEERTTKAILPCTPLAILKLLDSCGLMCGEKRPLDGKTVTVFNRSEVVGRPLAFMLANDGAQVFSFDIDGVLLTQAGGKAVESTATRAEALAQSDIVITGVPSKSFEIIRKEELKAGVTCVNFAGIRNFHRDVETVAKCFIPRIGPVTIAMCFRNTVRLYKNFCM